MRWHEPAPAKLRLGRVGPGPVALQHGFLSESTRALQWRAFLRRGRLDAPPEVEDLTSVLRSFLLPVLESAAGRTGACGHWAAGGPWRANSA